MRLRTEQRVVIAQRLLDFIIRGKRRSFGQAKLAAGFAFRRSPVSQAVLGDQPRGSLGDAGTVALRG